MAFSVSNLVTKTPKVSDSWKKWGSTMQISPATAQLEKKPLPASTPSAGLVKTPTPSMAATTTSSSPLQLLGNIENRLSELKTAQTSPSKIATPRLETPKKGLFESVLGSLTTPTASAAQQQYLDRLGEASRGGIGIGADAREIATKYGSEINRVGELGAGAVAGNLSTGTDVVGRGNAAIASQSASQRMNALAQGLGAELQGTEQQLTGNQQLISGLTSALGSADTQKAQALTSMINAGQLGQPSPSAYGQTVFDPTTGQFTGSGGNMDPQVQAQSLAQKIMSGQMTYDQALASLSYAGNAGTNFLNNAITSAGGNPLQLQAQGAGQQSNVGTQTTANTEIARQGLAEATQQYVQMNTAAEFANTQADAVSGILEQTGLNNVSSADYNKALNNVKGRFSDVNFASLNTALQEAQIAYTNLLSSGGGTPSGREEAALNTLNINQSAAAINASIKELENAVARRLQSQYGAVQQYQQNLGSSGSSSGGGGFAEVW